MTSSSTTPAYKEGLARQELKAMVREIPWRHILQMPAPYVDRFLQSIEKESNSWMTWQSVEPLSDEESHRILKDPVLSKNLEVTCMLSWQSLRKRWTLSQVSSSSPRPPRSRPKVSIPQCSYTRKSLRAACVFVHHAWSAWSGDAATAFLQGQQEERPLPLHLSPPRDGLIALTDTWILTIGLNQ